MNDKDQIKIVTIVHRPDGSIQVASFVREKPLPETFAMIDTIPVTSKTFKTMTKKFQFLFGKNFGG